MDDDWTIRTLLADLFCHEGYSVETAADGLEALETVRRSTPAAIVLDMMMPMLDGLGFLSVCDRESLCRGVPIIVVSAAYMSLEAVPELTAASGRSVVKKPSTSGPCSISQNNMRRMRPNPNCARAATDACKPELCAHARRDTRCSDARPSCC